jgi:hypothetical protein
VKKKVGESKKVATRKTPEPNRPSLFKVSSVAQLSKVPSQALIKIEKKTLKPIPESHMSK